ncbi:hypothetical protein BKA63DRAFT_500640 [Paraphoma chrysanthemicola]|nr:hypothetical protein BKA63DRAFT_500640 [Paraphoma chrysanthemicola]
MYCTLAIFALLLSSPRGPHRGAMTCHPFCTVLINRECGHRGERLRDGGMVALASRRGEGAGRLYAAGAAVLSLHQQE